MHSTWVLTALLRFPRRPANYVGPAISRHTWDVLIWHAGRVQDVNTSLDRGRGLAMICCQARRRGVSLAWGPTVEESRISTALPPFEVA